MNIPKPSPSEPSLDSVAGALSDGTRRAILRLVHDDERSAGDIAEQFPQMSRPAVSQHLRVLHDAGLVSTRSAGKFRMFRARTEGIAEMWSFLDEMWTDRLGRLKMVAERVEWPERQRAQMVNDGAAPAPEGRSTTDKSSNDRETEGDRS
jgi:DNA-binding transcriptional ArsR family regulator